MNTRAGSRRNIRSVALAAATMLVGVAATARAHNDPPGCSATGVSIEVRVFRMDGVTGVVGAVSQCEDINSQVVIKKSSAAACAFSGGTLTLTLPDGSMNQISGNVPCIGGTTSPCDPTVTELDSAIIPYTIKPSDISGGFILATAVYADGVAHDNEPDTPGVGAETPKKTPAVLCTDNNLCTNDFCDSTVAGAAACSHTPVNCDDNNACTADTCNATNGLCEHGAPPSCDDGNACTADSCNTTTGLCEHGAPPNCDDGNACTADSCNPTTGLCQHGAPPSCDDNNACTADSCNTTTGLCEHGAPPSCDDGNACTADSCNTTTGLCEHGAPPSCDDGNACTADSCNTTTGLCEHGAPPNCDDGNACTADSCNPTTGLCQHGAPPSCDDGNACTADSCNTTTGLCEHGAPPSCDDGNACTADSCNTTTGLCEHGAPPSCDDGNACTADSCNTTSGQCQHVDNITRTCNDNNACTVDSCNTTSGQCQHVDNVTPTCSDGNACTVDSCNTVTGMCQHVDTVTPTCDDNNACTNNLCNTVTGQCTFPPKSINCNDNNACTTDTCNSQSGQCQHVDTVTPTCGDNNACTVDSCNAITGQCQHMDVVTPTCDDNNPCTIDSCNKVTGQCQHLDDNNNPECKPLICRTPGFWGTHGKITSGVIALGGGCLEVCGEKIKNVSVASADSALEAICVSPRGDDRLQLARQLTSMALNCVVSSHGTDCGGTSSTLGALFDDCNKACRGEASNLSVGACTEAVDCFNNGGAFDADTGLCGTDPNGSCHERPLPPPWDPPGAADSPQTCNAARKNDCTVIPPGETSNSVNACTAGGTKTGPGIVEHCP
jgi:hypothetical protein